MALLLADSMEHNSNYDTNRYKWTNMYIVYPGLYQRNSTHKKTGTYGFSIYNANASGYTYYNKGSSFNGDVAFLQFHVKWTDFQTEQCLFSLLNTSNAYQSSLWVNYAGQLEIRRGLTTAVIDTSSSKIRNNVWYYFEVKWTVSNTLSADDIIIKVNGVEVLNPSSGDSADTANTTIQYIRVHSTKPNVCYVDNYIIMDNTGSTMNALQDEVFIEALFPDGNGNYSEWVGQDGNSTDNYLLVDEDTPDSATTYVESTTNDERDSYTFGDMAATPSVIKAVVANAWVTNQSTTKRTIDQFVRISATDYDSGQTHQIQSTTWVHSPRSIWEVSPATSSAWTKSEIDGAEFGIKVVA